MKTICLDCSSLTLPLIDEIAYRGYRCALHLLESDGTRPVLRLVRNNAALKFVEKFIHPLNEVHQI